jgi:hypothetical protein
MTVVGMPAKSFFQSTYANLFQEIKPLVKLRSLILFRMGNQKFRIRV